MLAQALTICIAARPQAVSAEPRITLPSIATTFGASALTDAFNVAFRIPNLFRRLFAEGAFASAFVPLFNRRMAQKNLGAEGGDHIAEAQRFAEEVMAFLIPVLIVFGGLALIAMPWIAGLFANEGISSDPELFDLAVLMARVAFPYLAFMSLATLFAAILNSLSRFAAAAAAPILLNLCMVVALIIGMSQGEGEAARRMTGFYLAIAVTLSGVLQLLWLWWFAHRAGFRMKARVPRVTGGVRESVPTTCSRSARTFRSPSWKPSASTSCRATASSRPTTACHATTGSAPSSSSDCHLSSKGSAGCRRTPFFWQ